MSDDEHPGDRRRDDPGRRSSDVEHALLLARIEGVEDELDAINDAKRWFHRAIITAAFSAGASLGALLVATMLR